MDENKSEIYKELRPGMELGGGKYVIEKKIGEGGFGITYKALQKGLNRAVCIKEYFLAGRCVRNTEARTIQLQGVGEEVFEKYRAAFVKEAQTLAALNHQGIVRVIDIFDENNTSYMVMPFIEGRSLQSIVEQNGPMDYPLAVNYVAQVANAVGYIHEHHILHRDIKPDNIMITADNKAVLIDFGSAREFDEDKVQAQTSMLTHGYAPPEQYTRSSRKGSYTDIYAIGATLYFVLTGRVPIEAAARITEQLPEPKELNHAIPAEANRTIMKAMQLKTNERHQNIAEFMDDLLNTGVVNSAEKTKREEKTHNDTSAVTANGNTAASGKSSPVEIDLEKLIDAALADGVVTKKERAVLVKKVKDAGGNVDEFNMMLDARIYQASSAAVKNTSVPDSKKSKKSVIFGVAAAVVALLIGVAIILIVIGHNNPHHREAIAKVEEYNSVVSKCNNLIGKGSDEDPTPLLEARKLLDSIVRPMDKEYADAIPDVYHRSVDIESALYPKLESAAKGWADDARKTLMREGGDVAMACQWLEYSLSLWDNPQVRKEYEDAKKMLHVH